MVYRCYLESVNWLYICMSCWLMCDLLMFGIASYAAFDVSVIKKCAREGLMKYYYYHNQPYCYWISNCECFGHISAQIVISAWLRSDLGRFGEVLNRVELDALIPTTAQPNLGSGEDIRRVEGDIWSVAQRGSHLPPGWVFEWEVWTISGWCTGSRSGLRQQSHWSNPGGLRSCSTPI